MEILMMQLKNYMMSYQSIVSLFFSLLLFVSCVDDDEKEHVIIKWSSKQSTDLANQISMEEEVAIKMFLKQRKDWNMSKTESGLRYWIYEKGTGESPKSGDMVKLQFEVRLLSDTLCYKTEAEETVSFVLKKSDVETGLHEGISYMNKSAKAKFIMPSHLGHGLLGDFDKIPPLQVLVFDVKLIDVKYEN